MFGKKLVSDALLATVKEVTSGEQIDSTGNRLLVGDGVTVQEGPHAGRTGTISGFQNTGRSEVQLDRGPSVAIYNEVLLNEGRLGAVIGGVAGAAAGGIPGAIGGAAAGHAAQNVVAMGATALLKKLAAKKRKKEMLRNSLTDEYYEELLSDHLLLDHLLAETGFDAIDKKALKKKWKDREDQDIDNDGDEDESDRFLHKRRKAIAKSKKKKNGNGNGNGEKIEINPEIKEAIRKLIHSTLK